MIFVDTSYWVAAVNRRDAHHGEAIELLPKYGPRGLVTTNHVRGETWTFLRRRMGHAGAKAFLDLLSRSHGVSVEFVSPEIERRALHWLQHHDEREYSFVDATSFAVMKSRRIREALAFDGDFSAAGFVELRV